MLWVCGGVAAGGVALALAFLPRRAAPVASTATEPPASTHEPVASG
jgi:hypothetical protein